MSEHIRINDVIMNKTEIAHVSIGDGGDSIDVVMRCGQEYALSTDDAFQLLADITRVLEAEVIGA